MEIFDKKLLAESFTAWRDFIGQPVNDEDKILLDSFCDFLHSASLDLVKVEIIKGDKKNVYLESVPEFLGVYFSSPQPEDDEIDVITKDFSNKITAPKVDLMQNASEMSYIG